MKKQQNRRIICYLFSFKHIKTTYEELEIIRGGDWNRTAEEIHNLVRGLSPYPAAWTQMVDVKNPEAIADVKIFQTAVSKDIPSLSPGEVKVTKNQLFVGTNDYPLEILSLQPAGKKRMEADAFLRGYSPMKFV